MTRRTTTLGLAAAAAFAGAAPRAWAATTSGLAIDTFLHNTLLSFIGPVAYAACLAGVVVAGSRLVSGGDLHQFIRTLVLLTLIAGLTLGGQSVISAMSANAAVVGALDGQIVQGTSPVQPERSIP